MSKKKQVEIKTPFGMLSAIAGGDYDYPNIQLYLNDTLIALAEYTSTEKEVRTLAYHYLADAWADEPQIQYTNATQTDIIDRHLGKEN